MRLLQRLFSPSNNIETQWIFFTKGDKTSKRKTGVFTVLLSCSLALLACSAKQETSGQAAADTTATDSPSNASNTETEQTEVDPVKELKSVEARKRENQKLWEALKNVDAPKVNEPVQVWEGYYAKLGLSSRAALQFTSSSEITLTYHEGRNDLGNEKEEPFVASFGIAPHRTTAGYDTTMSLQDALAITQNLLPKGYD